MNYTVLPPSDQAKDRLAEEHRAIFILGMHRSGTAALTRVLNLLGVHLGAELMPPDFNNPTGYWEHQELSALHDRLLQELGARWKSASLRR